MADDREAARKELESSQKDSKQKPKSKEKTPPPINLGEATGRAIFEGPDASKISKPGPGVPKRSLRLLRLIMVLTIAIGSFIVMIGFTRHPGLGILRILGVVAFLAFSLWCFFVGYKLWEKLK